MLGFMDENFLLTCKTARQLYHGYAKHMPIYDYHNHLSSKDIAEHRQYNDLAELWLESDHYKWRAMRANNVDERLITGNSSNLEKFMAWAATVPKLLGSPLYHWTHLELQRYFGINEILSPSTARRIWNDTRDILACDGFDAVGLLEKMAVNVLCTTDDPMDDLYWHKQIQSDSSIPFHVFPSFRPDRFLHSSQADSLLTEKYKSKSIFSALSSALDYFCENGCQISDHGFTCFNYGTDPVVTERMDFLGKQYSERAMAMQLHIGAIRNPSPRLMDSLGPDSGADCVGVGSNTDALVKFFAALEQHGNLPQTVIYNLNPTDNRVFAALAGSFAPSVQFGAAWWFNDHIRGIQDQLEELIETGQLAASVGMLTDSRSITSFVRHEYYRRILCNKIGLLVENGLYPQDIDALGRIVQDICYNNARRFFD